MSGFRAAAAKEAMLSDMSAWSRSVGLVGVASKDLTVSVKSDIEGVVRNLAQSFADGLTAVLLRLLMRLLLGMLLLLACGENFKESANTLCAGLERLAWSCVGKR